MSKNPAPAAAPGGPSPRIGLVTAEFNAAITDAMRDNALEAAHRLGCRVTADVRAPGTFDLPFIVHHLLCRADVDAVVALGAVVTGDTGHDELIASAAAHALERLAIQHEKPVGLGVTGPRQTEAQARARIDRAGAAVESVYKQFRTARSLRRRK